MYIYIYTCIQTCHIYKLYVHTHTHAFEYTHAFLHLYLFHVGPYWITIRSLGALSIFECQNQENLPPYYAEDQCHIGGIKGTAVVCILSF